MISPQLTSGLPPRRPDGAPGSPFHGLLSKLGGLRPALRELARRGGELKRRMMADVVVAGLWHCLLGSVAAGLAVSTVLGVLVLALSQGG